MSGTPPDEHAVELTVWDVPPAIGAGERFKATVGARCSAGCDLGSRALGIFDQEGRQVGTVKLGHDVCPGTEALYFAEVEAGAPLTAGTHQWEVRIADWAPQPPHAASPLPVVVRIVSRPDCEVTVKAVDRESQTPIKGALVVMHPYRAGTDKNGVAKVKVTRGRYDILVSGSQYLPACTSVEVIADMTTSAELEPDQAPEDVPE